MLLLIDQDICQSISGVDASLPIPSPAPVNWINCVLTLC